MYSQIKYSLLLCVFASAPVFSKDCIEVHDTENSKTYCQKFSSKERHTAKKYGLSLGMPYTKVKQSLLKNGWKPVEGKPGLQLICGNGYNHSCSSEFSKGKKILFLMFSGTNDGIPLTYIELTPN